MKKGKEGPRNMTDRGRKEEIGHTFSFSSFFAFIVRLAVFRKFTGLKFGSSKRVLCALWTCIYLVK